MKNLVIFISLIIAFVACSTQISKVELALETKSKLGEGAIWNPVNNRLYWVDISGGLLNIYNPVTNANMELRTGQSTSAVVPSESGKAIVALQNGIYQMDIKTGSKKLIIDPDSSISTNRYNDGKCDPAGRFWLGTMSNEGKKDGALYCMFEDGTAKKVLEGISISNGIVWSNDHSKMYYIDTPTQQVKAYDFSVETGEISNEKIVIEIPSNNGAPDGMTIDENGNLWIALWGGAAVACWNPATGEMIDKIDVPAKNVTSCAFGDEDLGTLYITTATEGLDKNTLKKYPLSGGLFKTKPGVKGVPAYFYKGNF